MANFVYGVFKALGYNHPFHPVLTHLVIGPVIAAFVIGLVAIIFHRPALLRTARHLNVFALIAWFFTAAMGIIDWEHFFGGEMMTPIVMKMILASVLFLVLLSTVLVNRRLSAESKVPVILYGVSTLCVVGLGFYGGTLVYG